MNTKPVSHCWRRTLELGILVVLGVLACLGHQASAAGLATGDPPPAYVAKNATVGDWIWLARVRWKLPTDNPPVTLEDCASACASAYTGCALFVYYKYSCFTLSCGVGSGGYCELYGANGTIGVSTKYQTSPEDTSWAGYVEGRVGAPPVASAAKGNLTFTRVDTYPYTPAPIPAWAVPETYGKLLANPGNCTVWTNRTGDRLTIANCSKCGWKLAQDWPDAPRMPYLFSDAGGASGWHDSVFGCLEPTMGYYAPYGLPIPSDRCKVQKPLPGFVSCSCKEGLVYSPGRIAQNIDIEGSYRRDGPTAKRLDPCIDPWEEWGCGPDLLENVTAGCKACPNGFQPAPTYHYYRDYYPDESRKCVSFTDGTAPVALHCLDNASCKPGDAPWLPTSSRRGGPYCTACAPDHVLTKYYPAWNTSAEAAQHLGCVSCSELGCAVGACDTMTGCARCLDRRDERRVWEVDGNRTVWACSGDVSLNWPLGPHGA